MNYQTAMIWDTLDGEIKLYLIEDDLTDMQDVYINSGVRQEMEDELTKTMFDPDTGQDVYETVMPEDWTLGILAGAQVVVCGFIP